MCEYYCSVCMWGCLSEVRVIVLRIEPLAGPLWRPHPSHTHTLTRQNYVFLVPVSWSHELFLFCESTSGLGESINRPIYRFTLTHTHTPLPLMTEGEREGEGGRERGGDRARARFRGLCLWNELSQTQRGVEEERAEKSYSRWESSACSFCSNWLM